MMKYPSIFFLILITGCKKLVTIDPPISSITTAQVFSKDGEAKAAMAGVYTVMINGMSSRYAGYSTSFASGLSTVLLGKMADELLQYGIVDVYVGNRLTPATETYGFTLWSSAYILAFSPFSLSNQELFLRKVFLIRGITD